MLTTDDLLDCLNSPDSYWSVHSPEVFWSLLNERARYHDERTTVRFAISKDNDCQPPLTKFTQFRMRWDGHHAELKLHPRLINGEITNPKWVLERVYFLASTVAYLLCGPSKPNGSVTISVADTGEAGILSFCSNDPRTPLLPDSDFLSTLAYRGPAAQTLMGMVPWQKREPVAAWRGTANGSISDRSEGWAWLPRAAMCDLSTRNPTLIDAKLTGVDGFLSSSHPDIIGKCKPLMGNKMALTDFMQRKYLVDIDGWSNSWAGLFQKLLTASVVLKVISPKGYRQWYYDSLIPWENYVPIRSDLADLCEVITRLQANDDLARSIGRKGRALALSLTIPSELRYMQRVLHDHASTDV